MARKEPRRRLRKDFDAGLRASEPTGSHPPPPEEADGYAVGYRKPPRHTQFKPGQSGNPRGRPKAPKSFDELIEKELAQLVTVREGDRAQRLPKRTVIVKQVVKKAMEGEDRALRSLLTLIGAAKTEKQQAAAKGEADPDAPLTNTEKGILAEYEAQLREKILQERENRAKRSVSASPKPIKEKET